MFMLFHGTDDVVEDFDSFESSLLAMFKLGVGLNDIGMLNQARIQWLAHTIFVVFVVLSFIHLFNALIAVMSQTFSGVHDYRNSYALYNKLRMIELFEDIVLFKVKSKYPFKPLFNRAKHWDKDDDDIDDEISIVNRSVRTDRFKNGKQERQVRFYSTMELDDLEDNRDDKEEKKKIMNDTMTKHLLKQRGTKRKTPNLKKSSKTNPEKDIIFVNIQKCNKSSEYPEGITLPKW